jgi:chemotaxis protein methyltransferase CheR
MTDNGSSSSREIPFTNADFQQLAALARKQFGLSLAESKKPLVYSRLSRRLKARNVDGFPEYLALLDKRDEVDERFELISALTTNVTSFFRENHHFEMLQDDVLPNLIQRAKSGGRLRIWSAGCSSGQEPYSIAMSLLDRFPDAANFDVRILATDIDPQIVAKAKAGTYATENLGGFPKDYAKQMVTLDPKDSKSFAIASHVKKLVTFAELNLISDWPFNGPFDAIFCRNVAIYFDQETQQRLWQRFTDMLAPGGTLFIGHSERVTGSALNELKGVGITSYRKADGAPSARLQ